MTNIHHEFVSIIAQYLKCDDIRINVANVNLYIYKDSYDSFIDKKNFEIKNVSIQFLILILDIDPINMRRARIPFFTYNE